MAGSTKLRVKDRFGIVASDILNDNKVSMAEQGLYAYIQSKPDGRRYSAQRIKKNHSDGLSKINSTLRGLVVLGLLTREQTQKPNGTFDWEYILHPDVDHCRNPEKPKRKKKVVVSEKEIEDDKKSAEVIDEDEVDSSSGGFLPGENEVIVGEKKKKSTTVKKKEFGDPEINTCIEMIKHYTDGLLNGTIKEQRIFSAGIIRQVKEMPKVSAGTMSWDDALSNILLRVSNNVYHNHKLGGPEIICRNLGSLSLIAKNTVLPKELIKKKFVKSSDIEKKVQEQNSKSVKNFTEEEKKQTKEMLQKSRNVIKTIP